MLSISKNNSISRSINWPYLIVFVFVSFIVALVLIKVSGEEITAPRETVSRGDGVGRLEKMISVTQDEDSGLTVFRNDALGYQIKASKDWKRIIPGRTNGYISFGCGSDKVPLRIQWQKDNRFGEILICGRIEEREGLTWTPSSDEIVFAGEMARLSTFSSCLNEEASTTTCVEKTVFIPSRKLLVFAGVFIEDAWREAKEIKPDILPDAKAVNSVLKTDSLYKEMGIDEILATLEFLK